ncbi:Hypothetical predicted protein [Paramuricea clavata]|uniref:Uncharacterized protein n=1 Tax=Paramuricea clavata TaxID=317549 RepID=A0A7D9H805_PARCT|nr:Hypothetical predicted protein [Paramuricea clavata]
MVRPYLRQIPSCDPRSRHEESILPGGMIDHVDDLILGASSVSSASDLKQDTITILEDASLQLHKWNLNAPELESNQPSSQSNADQNAKQQFPPSTQSGSKLLGVAWNKCNYTFSVVFPHETCKRKKRHSCKATWIRFPNLAPRKVNVS